MITKNLNVSNPRISFENIDLNFSQTGIYVIKGENGTGKTTLIEHLLYETVVNATFCSSEHQVKYPKQKHELFAYLPQQIGQPKISVKQYLGENKKLNDEKLQYYFTLFELEMTLLSTKFSNLSGGEQVKVAFVAALLKETPYLFLDEPTNNLDDKSVAQLQRIIKDLRSERTFILVTHDPRLATLEADKIITIDNHSEIHLTDISERPINISRTKVLPFEPIKTARRLFVQPLNIFILIYHLVVLMGIIVFNQFFLEMNYAKYGLPCFLQALFGESCRPKMANVASPFWRMLHAPLATFRHQ